jgi:large subunit ribosomal protein L22
MVGYTQDTDPEKTSRALGTDLKASPKKCSEVARNIRGMTVENAKRFLRDVIAQKRAVKYTHYKHYLSHKPGVGPGRYPKNAAKEILRVIESAQHNAEYKGLDSENMRIHTIAIHRAPPRKGVDRRAMGRGTQWNTLTVHIEIILEELEVS